MAYNVKSTKRMHDGKLKTFKVFYINYDDVNSIRNAEKQKEKLEKKGYVHYLTEQVGFNKFKIYYT